MKRHTITLLICLLSFTNTVSAQDIANNAMKEYLAPAEISKLDWILLKNCIILAGIQKWDDFGLVTSIDVYSTKGHLPIGMTFTVDNKQYIKLDNVILSKVFTDVVTSAYNIIKPSLPESSLNTDVHAKFVLVGGTGKIVAEFEHEKLLFHDISEGQ